MPDNRFGGPHGPWGAFSSPCRRSSTSGMQSNLWWACRVFVDEHRCTRHRHPRSKAPRSVPPPLREKRWLSRSGAPSIERQSRPHLPDLSHQVGKQPISFRTPWLRRQGVFLDTDSPPTSSSPLLSLAGAWRKRVRLWLGPRSRVRALCLTLRFSRPEHRRCDFCNSTRRTSTPYRAVVLARSPARRPEATFRPSRLPEGVRASHSDSSWGVSRRRSFTTIDGARAPQATCVAMNRRGPRDPSEGLAEASSPPRATLGRPCRNSKVGAGMETHVDDRAAKVPFECRPAKRGTVGRTRTPSVVPEPSRGRKRYLPRRSGSLLFHAARWHLR